MHTKHIPIRTLRHIAEINTMVPDQSTVSANFKTKNTILTHSQIPPEFQL